MATYDFNSIGKQIKSLRLQKQITLAELAHDAQVSKGLLSKLENGRTQVSLPVLIKLTEVLDVRLADFFFNLEHSQRNLIQLIRKDDYTRIEKETGFAGFNYFNIVNKIMGDYPVEIDLVRIDPQVKRLPTQTDALEFKYLIKGQLNYHIGDTIICLDKGDSLFFDGNLPHFPYNVSAETAELLVVYFFYQDHLSVKTL